MEIEKNTIIRIFIGVISAILIGILFVTVIPLIQPPQYILYWLMLIIGSVIPILFIEYIMQPSEEGSVFWCVVFCLAFGGASFGIEGTIIAFSAGGILWGFIPYILMVVGAIFIASRTGEAGAGGAVGMGLMAISGFILGVIYGGFLAIVVVPILIGTLLTGLTAFIFENTSS